MLRPVLEAPPVTARVEEGSGGVTVRSMARKMMPARDARPAVPMPDTVGGGIMTAIAKPKGYGLHQRTESAFTSEDK